MPKIELASLEHIQLCLHFTLSHIHATPKRHLCARKHCQNWCTAQVQTGHEQKH